MGLTLKVCRINPSIIGISLNAANTSLPDNDPVNEILQYNVLHPLKGHYCSLQKSPQVDLTLHM